MQAATSSRGAIAATAAIPQSGSTPSRLSAQDRREGRRETSPRQSRGGVRRSGVRPEPPSRGVAAETIAVLDPLIEKAASRRCAAEGFEQRRRHAVIDIFPRVAELYTQGARPIVIDNAIDRRTLVEPYSRASARHGADYGQFGLTVSPRKIEKAPVANATEARDDCNCGSRQPRCVPLYFWSAITCPSCLRSQLWRRVAAIAP